MTTVLLAKANIIDIAKELNTSALTYEYLCLSKTQKWCNELLYSLENVPISEESSIINYSKVNGFKRIKNNSNFFCLKIFGKDYKLYQLAKSYFNQKEFARSVYYLNKSESQLCYFLSVYAKYMVLLLLLLLLLLIINLNHFFSIFSQFPKNLLIINRIYFVSKFFFSFNN